MINIFVAGDFLKDQLYWDASSGEMRKPNPRSSCALQPGGSCVEARLGESIDARGGGAPLGRTERRVALLSTVGNCHCVVPSGEM